MKGRDDFDTSRAPTALVAQSVSPQDPLAHCWSDSIGGADVVAGSSTNHARDWCTESQERQSYRGWVWPGGQLSAPASARQVVKETLKDWHLGRLTGDVLLCVSELVTNAVKHAKISTDPLVPYQVVVGLRYFPTCSLFVEVGDCDPGPPVAPTPSGDGASELVRAHGHGLVIVRELADFVWWKRRGIGGKYVYAHFNTPRYLTPEGEARNQPRSKEEGR
ncbi:ATP-binding protein [Streptacidiphilus cavernicola]|uniref:ATP-binding protein n=1 Tax=Streptacidiphilus cavernicola TaxID=3342716 RepID=A0ABV6VSG7_9ACTN